MRAPMRQSRWCEEEKLDPANVERVRALVPEGVVATVCEPAANKRRPANS